MENMYEALARLAKMSKEEVLSLAKTEDGKDNPDFVKAIEIKIGEVIKSVGSDQYKRGQKESLTVKQKAIAAKYNITDQVADIESLIDLVVEAQKAGGENNGQSSALEEQIKNLSEANKSLKLQLKEISTKYSELEKQRVKDKILMHVEAEAERQIAALGIQFPEDEAQAQRARKYLINQVLQHEYTIDEGGGIIPLDKNGQPLQNEKYENVGLKDLVLQNNMFPLKTNATPPNPINPKGGGGNILKFSPDQLKAENVVNEVQRLKQEGKLAEAKALKDAYAQKLEQQDKPN